MPSSKGRSFKELKSRYKEKLIKIDKGKFKKFSSIEGLRIEITKSGSRRNRSSTGSSA